MSGARRYYLGFNLVRGVGAVRLASLISHFGEVGSAWNAKADDLRAAGLGPKTVARMMTVRQDVDLEALEARILAQGIVRSV